MKPRRSIWLSGYWIVLVLLALSYTFCAIQGSQYPSVFALLWQLGTVAATLKVAEVSARARYTGWVALAVTGLALVVVLTEGLEGRLLNVLLTSASLVAYLLAPAIIISHQLGRKQVDGQTLLASIAAYIMVGMFFTFVYNLIGLTTTEPLFGVGNDDSLSSQLFFSFTTLTTTGYGNLVPVGALVQSVAIAEAITGQLFLVIAVAGVVSAWRPPARGSA